MKEFVAILTLAVTLTFAIVFGVHYLIDVRPCGKYGEMVKLESKFISGRSCYVKRDGVWIEKFYNDQIEIDKLKG